MFEALCLTMFVNHMVNAKQKQSFGTMLFKKYILFSKEKVNCSIFPIAPIYNFYKIYVGSALV